jgi:hypothetical protein
VPIASTFGYTSERLWPRMGWVGLVRLAAAVSLCTVVGFLAARLVGFPLYPGWQGVFVQQPLSTAGLGLIAAAVSLLLGLAVALAIAPPVDLRMPAVVAATTLLGFSIRGGTMASVMQAAGEREVFWLLAAELAVLMVLVMLTVAIWRGVRGAQSGKPGVGGSVGLSSGAVQFVATAAMLWILGRNYPKPQAICSILFAAGIGTWVAHLATGHIWRWAWIVPMVVGILGYVVCAIWATGVEIANVQEVIRGFAIALPLDYAAVGALGVVLGTVIARGEENEMPEAAGKGPKVAGQE